MFLVISFSAFSARFGNKTHLTIIYQLWGTCVWRKNKSFLHNAKCISNTHCSVFNFITFVPHLFWDERIPKHFWRYVCSVELNHNNWIMNNNFQKGHIFVLWLVFLSVLFAQCTWYQVSLRNLAHIINLFMLMCVLTSREQILYFFDTHVICFVVFHIANLMYQK